MTPMLSVPTLLVASRVGARRDILEMESLALVRQQLHFDIAENLYHTRY